MPRTSNSYHLKSHIPSIVTGQEKNIWGITFWATYILGAMNDAIHGTKCETNDRVLQFAQ
jgi:hypothetical protein